MSKFGDLMQSFIMSKPQRAGWFLSKAPASVLEKLGKKNAVALVQEAALKIPAYQDFLSSRGVDPQKIKNLEELPMTDKESYLQKYPLEELCLEPAKKMDIIYRSSGNSGIPFWWPQLTSKDKTVSRYFDFYYKYVLDLEKYSTLVVNTFAMGLWVAGMTIATNFKQVALTGKYPLTIVSPGSDIESSLEVVTRFGKLYDQIFIMGYPPFLGNLVTQGKEMGIKWPEMRIRVQTGGETFSEAWRQNLREELGITESDLLAVTSVFGSSDTGSGMAGFENALTILIKRLCSRDSQLCSALFGSNRLPTLVQFVPMSYFVEEIDGEIVLTSRSGIPLLRYNIHDRGGVIPFKAMLEKCSELGFDLISLLDQNGYREIWRLPFFFCFGRMDAVSIDGANIYIDDVQAALSLNGAEDINNFKMAVERNKAQNMRFVIYVELKEGFIKISAQDKAKLIKKYHNIFLAKLTDLNCDFRNAYENNTESCDPQIRIYRFGQGPFTNEENRIKQRHVL